MPPFFVPSRKYIIIPDERQITYLHFDQTDFLRQLKASFHPLTRIGMSQKGRLSFAGVGRILALLTRGICGFLLLSHSPERASVSYTSRLNAEEFLHLSAFHSCWQRVERQMTKDIFQTSSRERHDHRPERDRGYLVQSLQCFNAIVKTVFNFSSCFILLCSWVRKLLGGRYLDDTKTLFLVIYK